MLKIKRALVSVSDKTGIIDFAKGLKGFEVEIISTGGTAKQLKEAGISVIEVSEFTGFPEMLDGRVKTLHPMIHAGLLALRENPEHMKQVKNQNIKLIDMVVVNLYPFENTIKKPGVSLEEANEFIDIGGPSMLRSAAKNARSVAVISNPSRYNAVLKELKKTNGSLSESTLTELGVEVFKLTSHYDAAIYDYLHSKVLKGETTAGEFPSQLSLEFQKVQDLRYGENPHQRGAFYREAKEVVGISAMKQLWGKELSFNNILDLNAAVNIVKEFQLPAVAFIKHNNPCGVAENKDLSRAYKDAWTCDKLSAFGGILSVNRKIDLALAKLIARSGFLECIITAEFSADALSLLKAQKNLRLLELPNSLERSKALDFKKVNGGLLLQDEDSITLDEKNLKTVTKAKATKSQLVSLIFACKVAKHVKSNAIVLAKGTRTVGIGAGQMSRVDAVYIALKKSGKLAQGSVLASDAFFPKEDALQIAIRAGIEAIIQPGGSIADEAIIKICNKHKIPMLFTGIRHFRH